MNIRHYTFILALSMSQLVWAQQQKRAVEPIDRQVNADVLAQPQQMLPDVVTHTQPISADILEPPQLAPLEPARSKSAAANQTASRWTLAPGANPKDRGFSTTSPPALSQLPPPASSWTLGPALNPMDRGLSTTSPPALNQLPPPASSWTLGPSLKAMEQNTSASINPAPAMTQVAPTAASGWMHPKNVPDKTSLPLAPGQAPDRLGSGTIGTASRPDLSGTRSLFQTDNSRRRPDDPGAVGAETGLAATETANSAILYGKHFEPTQPVRGLESPFASPMSATRQTRQLSPNGYVSLHSHSVTLRESAVPAQLRHRPEVRRALRMASSHGQRDGKSSYCKLRPQCATQAKSKSSSRVSRRSQSNTRLRLESALGN